MPLRVLNRKGRGNVFDISKAVFFAERNGADVINLSLGTPGPTPTGLVSPELLRETVDEAIRRGVVAAAAAGNSGKPYPNYPAARGQTADDHDGLLAVTSVSCREQKSEWANYGLWVDIASPGEGILSAFPVRRYANWSGTSMATPFVSGQAALIRADDNTLDPAGVEVQIRDSARPLVGRDIVFGTFLGAGQTDIGASLGQPDPVPEPALCPAS
jgi:subtilisin family serine protease